MILYLLFPIHQAVHLSCCVYIIHDCNFSLYTTSSSAFYHVVPCDFMLCLQTHDCVFSLWTTSSKACIMLCFCKLVILDLVFPLHQAVHVSCCVCKLMIVYLVFSLYPSVYFVYNT